MAFRPGTKQLAAKTRTSGGTKEEEEKDSIVLWDLEVRREVARFPIADNAFFSPDGAVLASQGKNGIRVWDVATSKERPVAPASAQGHFVSPREMLLTEGGRKYGWDVIDGRETFTWPHIPDGLTIWATSADDRVALAWGRLPDATKEVFVVWDLPGNKRLATIPEADPKPRVCLSPDGRRLAIANWDESQFSIKVRDTQTGALISRMTSPGVGGLSRSFPGFQFSPEGRLIGAAEGRGGSAGFGLWDVESGARFAFLREVEFVRWVNERILLTTGTSRLGNKRADLLSTGRWSQYGVKRLRSVSMTHYILWDVTPGTPSGGLDVGVESLSFNRDGSRLITNDVVWEVVRRPGPVALRREDVPDDGTFPVFRGKDELWWTDLPTWKDDFGVGRDITVGRLGSDSLKVALPNPGYPELEKKENERLKNNSKEDLGWPSAMPQRYRLEFGPDGRTFLLASKIEYRCSKAIASHSFGQRCLELWDAAAPKRLALWDTSTRWWDFRFTPDGRRVVARSEDGQLAVWDVARGSLERHLAVQSCVLFAASQDGKTVLAIDDVAGNVNARLFEVETGLELRKGPVDKTAWQVTALGPTAGHIIASAGDDGTIHLWDGASGRELAHWQAHDSRVTALAFNPEGSLLVSGGDGTVKLWDLPYIRKELATLGLDW
jgi:WD40 repeat protein